jgi:hypothetical protein
MSRCIIPLSCDTKVELDVLSLVQNLLEMNARQPHHKSTPMSKPMKFPLKPEILIICQLQDHACGVSAKEK